MTRDEIRSAVLAALDTRAGYPIPGGGGVAGLSGLAVEVRDTNGAVVLKGNFPDMTVN